MRSINFIKIYNQDKSKYHYYYFAIIGICLTLITWLMHTIQAHLKFKIDLAIQEKMNLLQQRIVLLRAKKYQTTTPYFAFYTCDALCNTITGLSKIVGQLPQSTWLLSMHVNDYSIKLNGQVTQVNSLLNSAFLSKASSQKYKLTAFHLRKNRFDLTFTYMGKIQHA
jgi:hypothetical protein